MGQVTTRLLGSNGGTQAAPLALPAPGDDASHVVIEERDGDGMWIRLSDDPALNITLTTPPTEHVDKNAAREARAALNQMQGLSATATLLEYIVREPARVLAATAHRPLPALMRELARPQVVVLHGPAGLGKARLLRLATHAEAPHARLHWITTERDLERADKALESEQQVVSQMSHAQQRKCLEGPPPAQAVYVLDEALVGRAYDCMELWRRFVPRFRNHKHMPGSAWKGLRPRLVLLLEGPSVNDLPQPLRNAAERWVYDRPPNRAQRHVILKAELNRIGGALFPDTTGDTVSKAGRKALVDAWAWWTPAELLLEVALATERFLETHAQGERTPQAYETFLAAWPNHNGQLAHRQGERRRRFGPYDDRYGKTGLPLDREPKRKRTSEAPDAADAADAPPKTAKRARTGPRSPVQGADAPSPPPLPSESDASEDGMDLAPAPPPEPTVERTPVTLDMARLTTPPERNQSTIRLEPGFSF